MFMFRSEQNRCLYSALSMSRPPTDNLTPEERDARTVFCMQLAARIRPRDLEEFFSAVGKVRPGSTEQVGRHELELLDVTVFY